MLLLQQMLVLFLLMLLGFFLRKKEILDAAASRKLSWLVVHVANPALILSGSVGRSAPVEPGDLGLCLGLASLIFVGLLLAAAAVTALLRVPEGQRGVYRIMFAFSNVGFMGFPVVKALYGSDALLYASIFLIPYNLLLYTVGIAGLKAPERGQEKVSWKRILNIGVLSCLASLAVALFRIPTPDFVKTTVSELSGLTAPLSMMVIGASMAETRLKSLFTDARLLLFSACKLLAMPVAGMLLLRLFIQDRMLLGVCLVMLSTPVGSMTAMLAQEYGGDYELDSRGVALTTLLSVLTMPAVSLILGM